MKINKQTTNWKKILITVLVVLTAGLISVGVYSYYVKSNENARHEASLESIDANKNPVQGKSIEGSQNQTNKDNKIVTPTGEADNSNLEKPSITRAIQSSGGIRVSAIYTQPAFGNCILMFKKEGFENISVTAPVVVGPSYYTCDGFLVPVAKFPTTGSWIVEVTHEYNGQTVASETQTIEVK